MTTDKLNFSERVLHDLSRGEIRDGATRYMMIRPDGLMGLFRNLDEHVRDDAFRALAHSIYEHGGKSAQTYVEGSPREAISVADGDALLAVIVDTAPRLGWGTWRFERPDSETLNLAVSNSPFAVGYGVSDTPVCAPISGMLRAVSELVFGAACTVIEHNCASVVDGADCRFTSRRES